MAEKTQFMVSIDELDADRIGALRIVLGVSQAQVSRDAMFGLANIPVMEASYADRLGRLYAVAKRAAGDESADWRPFVRALIKGRQVIPSLEALEDMPLKSLKAELRFVHAGRRSTSA